jgi:hypothetical protein
MFGHTRKRVFFASPRTAEMLVGQCGEAHIRAGNPLALLLVCLAGWMNRQQQNVIEYLQEEVRVLKEQFASASGLANSRAHG